MKVMAILFRVLFSIIILLGLACYLQVSPTISLSDFYTSFNPAPLVETLKGINAITISLVLVLLLGIFSFTRILEATWNVLFSASIIVLLACGSYGLCGPGIALPHALYNNEAIRQFCEASLTYQIPLVLAGLIFVAGWLCASACGRVAITTIISYGLWYGISEFFSYIVHIWSSNPEPAAPEALNMILGTPWVIAAVPGAFFLIYALLMSLFETFITNKPAKQKAEAKPAAPATEPSEKKEAAPAAKETVAATTKQPTKPITEPKQKTLRLATGDAAPKKLKTTAPADTTKEAPAKEKEEVLKAEEKTAESETTEGKKTEETVTPKVEAEAPVKTEGQAADSAEAPAEKPAEAPAAPPAEPQPEKPAEAPAEKQAEASDKA